jgi:hypothetical protein
MACLREGEPRFESAQKIEINVRTKKDFLNGTVSAASQKDHDFVKAF